MIGMNIEATTIMRGNGMPLPHKCLIDPPPRLHGDHLLAGDLNIKRQPWQPTVLWAKCKSED